MADRVDAWLNGSAQVVGDSQAEFRSAKKAQGGNASAGRIRCSEA